MSRGPRIELDLRGRLGGYAPEMARRSRLTLGRVSRRLGLGPRHELSVILCDNPWIRRINRRWRGIDRPTDVLAFPLHELSPGRMPPHGAVGDLVVSLPRARRDARELGEIADARLARLLIHGLLHLLGHDHDTSRRAASMRRAEDDLLGRIGR